MTCANSLVYFVKIQTQTYTFLESTWSLSIYDKAAAKKHGSPSTIVFLDMETTLPHKFLYNE